jgi:hypothetical protein
MRRDGKPETVLLTSLGAWLRGRKRRGVLYPRVSCQRPGADAGALMGKEVPEGCRGVSERP